MAVRAQRKFALKAHVPGSPENNNVAVAEQPSERENAVLAQPFISIVREPVNDLIDQMAFKSLHNHPKTKEKEKNLKDVRIILKRISPPRTPSPSASRSNNNVSFDVPKEQNVRKAESVAESAFIKNLKHMKLRNRVLSRDWPVAAEVRNALRSKRVTPQQVYNPSRRTRETSSEDNRPLTYFANSKCVKNKRNDLMNTDNSLLKHRAPAPRFKETTPSRSIRPREACTSKSNKPTETSASISNNEVPKEQDVRNTESIAESALIKNLKQMKLRNRVISREWASAATARNKFRGTSQHQLCNPYRRTSETSIEDNRPLTYFANSKVLKNKRNDLKNKVRLPSKPIVTRKSLAKKKNTIKKNPRVKETQNSPVRRRVMRHDDVESAGCGDSLVDNSPTLNTILPEETSNSSEIVHVLTEVYSVMPDGMPQISNIRKVEVASTILDTLTEDDTSKAVKENEDINPPNPLSEFLRYIFNRREDSESDNFDARPLRSQMSEDASEQGYLSATAVLGRNDDHMSDISLARVQEWLTNQNAQQNQTVQPEFKVPVTPRLRDDRPSVRPPASSVSSTRSNMALPLSAKERLLRNHCTAWNYVTLSDVISKPHLIRRFCSECTRCKVMFNLDNCQRPSSPVPADVYDFNSEQDDDTEFYRLPYRTNRLDDNLLTNNEKNKIFVKISKQQNYMAKLKEIMTEKGKKILEAAVIMRENIHEALLPRNHIILAQVIAILIECNAARIDDVRQPLPPSIPVATAVPTSTVVLPLRRAREIEQKPSTSSNSCRLNDDVDMSPPTRKRTRQYEIPEPSTPLPIEAALQTTHKFFPSVEEFSQSPVTYAFNMLRKYPGMSLCGVKPPPTFSPAYYITNPQMNFNASNQYIHRMLKRWGVVTQELIAIRSLQDPKIQRSPLFEGLEVDLVKLYHTVQEERGIEACQNNNEKWQVVASKMKLHYCNNKAHTKLENIYLKYLLNYNTLTCTERDKTFEEVNKCWRAREAKAKARVQVPLWRQNNMRLGLPLGDDEELSLYEKVCVEAEECITSGRYCNYNGFKKLSQQVMKTYFPNTPNPSPEQVEVEYWGIVSSASGHVCVHAGSVEATEHGAGFTNDTSDAYGNHPWNLKRLSMSSTNLLHYLGPDVGVSSTTVHYGMLFSTSCWHMDPTSVPWIEYLHTGSPKIWYSVAADQSEQLRSAVEMICPLAVQNKDIWLPSDIVMIPPKMLRQYGVTVHRHVQNVGEYVIVYPNTYTACIDTGFTVSEGVYFAPCNWIKNIDRIFQNLRVNAEPSLFSMEKLLISMSRHERTPYVLLEESYTLLVSLLRAELTYRNHLANRNIELMTPEVVGLTQGQTSVCARHGVHLFEHSIKRGMQISNIYCIVLITNAEINEILENLKLRLSKEAV